MSELQQDFLDHHYVPNFYLKGFTDKNGSLWVYEKGKNAPRESTPRREANRPNYYTVTDRGSEDNSTEAMFAKAECLVAPVIRKLANPQFKLNDQQRSELFTFVALTFVRVPAYRDFLDRQVGSMIKRHGQDHARDREKFYSLIREYERKTGQSVGDPEKVRQFALSDNYTVVQKSNGFNLGLALKSSLTIFDILEAEYSYDIYYAPNDAPFFTCDNPVITIEPASQGSAFVGGGFGRPKTKVVFPLNKRACLILSRGGTESQLEASHVRVKQVNDMVMGVAQRCMYASVSFGGWRESLMSVALK